MISMYLIELETLRSAKEGMMKDVKKHKKELAVAGGLGGAYLLGKATGVSAMKKAVEAGG